eukprot:Gb_09756 [translate_table: standard]
MVEEDVASEFLPIISIAHRERGGDEIRLLYQELNDAERPVLRSCGLGHVCQIIQLLADSTQLIELIQHWDIDRQAFLLPTFGVMRITRYDIYRIMGVSWTGDEDRVPCMRRMIALIILFRVSFSQNFSGLPFSWNSVIRQIGPPLPLGGDDPAMLIWQMVSRGSPRQESHRRKGGAHVSFVQLDMGERALDTYRGMQWDSDDEVIELHDAPQQRHEEAAQIEQGAGDQQEQGGDRSPIRGIRVEAPVVPPANVPSTSRVADVASTSGESTMTWSQIEGQLRRIFCTELAARPPSVPSTSHTERGSFGIAEDIVAMYQDLDRRYAKARGEIRVR